METKRDALTGVRLGAFSRMLACALSIALMTGLMPAGAVAYAAEGAASGESGPSQDAGAAAGTGSADRVNRDVPLDSGMSGSGSGNGAEEGSAGVGGDALADGEGGISPGQEGSGDKADGNGPAARYTASAGGQTSADVALDGGAKVGTIEYNGLAYTINPDDPSTVSVTGIASTAPKGDVSIPSQVASGSELYKVTGIARGGGYHRLMLLMR